MPYPAGHRAQVKRKIVESARKLFNRHGFDGVSLNQIMAGAGLTHGGFYSYFKSKSDLYAEVLGCFFTDPNWKNCWEGVEVDLASTKAGEQLVRAYLSDQHLENVENSCPMVALPSDVARSGPRAKRAFQTVFQGMVSVLDRSLRLPDAQRRPRPAKPKLSLLSAKEAWSSPANARPQSSRQPPQRLHVHRPKPRRLDARCQIQRRKIPRRNSYRFRPFQLWCCRQFSPSACSFWILSINIRAEISHRRSAGSFPAPVLK